MVAAAVMGILLALFVALPLAWKWELGVRRVAIAMLALGFAAGIIVGGLSAVSDLGAVLGALLVAGLTLAAATAVLAYRFYRDPERTPPEGEVIVSPADGTVIYLRRSSGGMLPISTKHGSDYRLEELTRTPLASADSVVIGIAMSFLDVHVNRAPIAGQVTVQSHFAGTFGSLKRPEQIFENERATTVINGDRVELAVVQIASRLVRQIVSYVQEGQEVALADRIGVIRLGSQVDLVLPATDGLRVTVQPGEHVRAGESIVAVFERAETFVPEALRSRP